jgi:hypothetical protein
MPDPASQSADRPAVKYQNHILIGLGGTGGSVLKEFRKDMFRRHGAERPDGIRVEYLYVDSSQSDLDNESEWKVLGQSVQLPQSSRMSIHAPELAAIVENAPAFPGIASWLGPRHLWTEYLSALTGLKAAGGQRRRLGRLLFACNVQKFNAAITEKYNAILSGAQQGEPGTSGVTFHIICGLAGGTGSGSVVDAAVQIGKFLAERKQTLDRIVIYAYLPESSPPAHKAEKYYIANGYAALRELNALSAGRFLPFDVAGSQRFKVGEFMPFHGCYVLTNETETGTSYHPDDVPTLLSGFLYQKTVAVRDAGAWDSLVRLENAENGLPDCEPRVGLDGRKLQPERSVRFLTFGIKRIAIPEVEIQEYLAYSYARESVRQLRYNHWSTQFGFIDNVRNNDFSEYRSEDRLASFRCSWDHLILSKAILETDCKKKWDEIDEYWGNYLDHSMEEIISGVDKKFWLNEAHVQATSQLQDEYRGDGAARFYEQKAGTVKLEAKEVGQLLETYLLTEFLDGHLSLTEITGSKAENSSFLGIVEIIKAEMSKRGPEAQAKAEHFGKLSKEIDEALDGIEYEYSRVGIIDPLGRRTRLLNEHKQALQDFLSAKTKEQGYLYAAQLCPEIVSQLETLYERVQTLFAGMNNLFQQLEDNVKKRCTEGDTPDFGRAFIKFYNATAVRDYAGRVRMDQTLMTKQCAAVRSEIKSRLGFDKERPTFKEFNSRLPAASLAGVLEQICSAQSRTDHDALLHRNEDRLFGVALVPRILQEFRTPEALGQFAKRLVPQATTLAALDETERGNVTANNNPGSIIRRAISIICQGIEDSQDHPRPEVRPLLAALRGAPPAGTGVMEFVDAPSQPSEMVVVSLTNLMPLRCVKRVAFLRSRYEQLLTGEGASKADAMFLHLESDGTQYPSLFAMSMNEVREKSGKLLLQASACGVLQETDACVRFEEKDPLGEHIGWVVVGTDIIEAMDSLTPAGYAQLSALTNTAVQGQDRKLLLARIAEIRKQLETRFPDQSERLTKAYRQISTELLPQ